MKKLVAIGIILIIPFLSCDDKEEIKLGPKEIKLSATQVQLIEGANRFGFDLFMELLAEADAIENVFISPLSVHLALSMTWNGARNNTGQQMKATMYYPDISDEEINTSIKKLIADLLSVDEKVETGIANSIWYRDGFSVEQSFLDVNAEYFDAFVSALNFDDSSSRDIINAWVAEKTKDKIREIVDQIDPDHIMFLINAIYFNGIWSTEFVKENSRERPFYLSPDKTKDVMTMETEGEFAWASRDGYKVAELPYGRGNFSMLVFLPDPVTGLDEMVEKLTPEEWDDIPEALTKNHRLNIRLPKFTFDYDNDLNSALINLGMEDAFDGYRADFTGINKAGGLYISRVRHKSFVEVNEEGTEAAAVTSVEIRLVSVGPDDPEVLWFHVDRPFVFAIREKFTNSLIFIGRVMEP